jgi:hypothetical protein
MADLKEADRRLEVPVPALTLDGLGTPRRVAIAGNWCEGGGVS